jgi:hypothetical protein
MEEYIEEKMIDIRNPSLDHSNRAGITLPSGFFYKVRRWYRNTKEDLNNYKKGTIWVLAIVIDSYLRNLRR